MDAIILKNVWKVYKIGETEIYALRDVNLRIKEGEMVGILGPSGSGKSTLVHIIGCMDKPTKGEVYLFGKNILSLKDKDLAELRKKYIGFVFQMFYLFPNMTALENVEIPMIFAGVPKKKRIEKAKELLKAVNLLEKANNLPSQLSGGEQQRVAIARALANDPKIILADEPTGDLDIKSSEIIINLFKKLNKEYGKTVVIVTHDIKIAKNVDRIIVIKKGSIVADNVSIDEALEILKE